MSGGNLGLPPRAYAVLILCRRAAGILHTISVKASVLVGDVDWRVPTGAHEKKGNAGRGGRDAWMLNVRHGIGDVINFVYS